MQLGGLPYQNLTFIQILANCGSLCLIKNYANIRKQSCLRFVLFAHAGIWRGSRRGWVRFGLFSKSWACRQAFMDGQSQAIHLYHLLFNLQAIISITVIIELVIKLSHHKDSFKVVSWYFKPKGSNATISKICNMHNSNWSTYTYKIKYREIWAYINDL